MKKLIAIICVIFIAFATQAQEKKRNAKLNIAVDGICNMCKKRIEKTALNTKGVKFANWDVNTHQLTVIVDERKTNKTLICQNLATAGHDSKEIKASKEAYDNLHPCCKYRNEEVINEHN